MHDVETLCVYTHQFECIHHVYICTPTRVYKHVQDSRVYTHICRDEVSAVDKDTPIRVVRPDLICSSDELLEKHIRYWVDRMPDISDKPQMPPSEMKFWKKQARKSRLKPHPSLPGVCAVWLNGAIDFAIKNNKWPVRFKDANGVSNDMVPDFTVTVWVKYVTKMVCLYTHTTHIICIHTLCEWARVRERVCVRVRPCVTYTRANGWPGTPLPTATCLNREMPRVTRLRVTVASW